MSAEIIPFRPKVRVIPITRPAGWFETAREALLRSMYAPQAPVVILKQGASDPCEGIILWDDDRPSDTEP